MSGRSATDLARFFGRSRQQRRPLVERSWIRDQIVRVDGRGNAPPPPMPEYENRPLDYAREVLGLEPWADPDGDGQVDIFEACGRRFRKDSKRKKVTGRSGHKTGKTTSAAALAWWFYSSRRDARVVCTAPTSRQVHRAIWREIRRLKRNAKRQFEGEVPTQPSTGVQASDGREILGFTADDPDSFSGISGQNVLYIVDEASGVAEAIFDAIEGNRAGGACLLLLGNPTQVSGRFYESHHDHRAAYECLHLNSERAAQHGGGIPGIAVQEWVDEMEQDWGRESPLFQVRVLGNFPREGANTVISIALIESGRDRWAEAVTDGALVLGVDVAREGDDESVITPRRGKKIMTSCGVQGCTECPELVMRSMDGVQVAGRVAEVARHYLRKGERKAQANVDVIGVGASVVDQLNYQHNDVVRVLEVNTALESDDPERYHNLRTQLHYGMRDWLSEGGAIPDDPKLQAELVAPKYKYDARGRYQVERKDEIKERLKRSPDRGDSAMLAVYGKKPAKISKNAGGTDRNAGSRWDDYPGRGFG